MKIISLLPLFILFLIFSNVGYSQKELTVENLQSITKQKNTVVYVSALWCAPCVEKLKEASDSLVQNNDIAFRHIIVFDRMGFKWSKFYRLNLGAFDSSSVYFIPKLNYSKAIIQINPLNKVLRRYMAKIKRAYNSEANLDNFWIGMAFLINDNRLTYPIPSEL